MSDPPMSVLHENLRKNADSQPMKAFCAKCPEWQAVGTAEEVRQASVKHREEVHPETLGRKSSGAGKRFAQRNLSREREEEIKEERRKRRRDLGIPLEE